MGTRSITRVMTAKGVQLVNMYRQYDGYPSGHGAELAEFIDGMLIVNGIQNERMGDAANGAGCLAAQLIGRFKDKIGGVYLYPVDQADCEQDFEYRLTVFEKYIDEPEGRISIEVVSYGKVIFAGNTWEFVNFCAQA